MGGQKQLGGGCCLWGKSLGQADHKASKGYLYALLQHAIDRGELGHLAKAAISLVGRRSWLPRVGAEFEVRLRREQAPLS